MARMIPLIAGLAWIGAGIGPAWAQGPSFDCSKADSTAEDAVCASETLSALDRELTRVYSLAVKGPNMTDDRVHDLRAFQRGWVKGRNDCWKSSLGVEHCVLQEYVLRIGEIRTEFADARSEDGASTGPFPYVCEGMDVPVSVVFISAPEAIAGLTWLGGGAVLTGTPAGSGSKYTHANTTFWVQGDDATLTQADGQEVTCSRDAMN
ncbi:MliC family protein [Aliisedimentitalea scapharcae]|uniref:MliC family protein n=1 Tax=Aliisedimentitalea scapharcae TaxID=1524259 RepID=A0ABZ2XUK9_9RHOB